MTGLDPQLFAIPLVVILSALMLLHAYWALGGRWGTAYTIPTVGGRRSFDPSPLATWVVCALLGMAVILVMGRVGWIGIAPLSMLFNAGVWGLSLVFLLRAVGNLRTFGFFKSITGTRLPSGTPGFTRPFVCCWQYSRLDWPTSHATVSLPRRIDRRS